MQHNPFKLYDFEKFHRQFSEGKMLKNTFRDTPKDKIQKAEFKKKNCVWNRIRIKTEENLKSRKIYEFFIKFGS